MTDEIEAQPAVRSAQDQCVEMDLLLNQGKRNSRISLTFSDVSSDIIIKSRIRHGNCSAACKGLWLDYSKNSNIHGLRYMFRIHSSIYEKLFFVAVCLVSLYCMGSLIVATFLKWQNSLVILSFDETLVPVYKIPFPTVTICPEIKSDQNIFNFGNISNLIENGRYDNLTVEQLTHLTAIMQLCDLDIVKNFALPFLKESKSDVTQTLVNLTISKSETAPFCKWNGRFYICDKLLNFVPTDDGICYQFNGMQSKDIYRDPNYMSYSDEQIVDFNDFFDTLPSLNNLTGTWSLEDGYKEQGYNSYPQRTIFSSRRNAFFAFLQGFEHNLDYKCRKFKTQGYKIFLNSPESVPSTTSNYILVPHGFEVMVSVLPHYIYTDKNLLGFSPAKRQCYFNDERYLRFFRHYSQSNCQTECLANYTIAKCGCAKFWMPKPLDVPTCGIAEIDCYTNAQTELNLIMQNQKGVDSQTQIICNCMPACTSLEYNVEISSTIFDMAETLKAFNENMGSEFSNFLSSRLSIYFKEREFRAIKRRLMYRVTTLIANCGGILSLFMGISSLSLIELIYFFSVRLVTNLRNRRQTKTKDQKVQQEHHE